MEDNYVSKFLENFPTYRLHIKPETLKQVWVFDSQNNSSSGDGQTTWMIQDKIKSALSSQITINGDVLLYQLWVPVEIGGRRLLSTSAQPFAVTHLGVDSFVKYRQQRVEYKYDIEDVNYTPDGTNPMIITTGGPPATAFLNRLPHLVYISKDRSGDPLTQSAFECKVFTSIMIPICPPSQTSPCIGVLQCSSFSFYRLDSTKIFTALEEAGLSIYGVQQRIPYKTVHHLKPVRDQIKEAIKIVCTSGNQLFSQVWIANYEDKHHVHFSSSFEYTGKKQMLALKLTGYSPDILSEDYYSYIIKEYNLLSDICPLDTGESLVEKTLQDYESRFYITYDKHNRNHEMSIVKCGTVINGIVICLRSVDTGDVCYAFEFVWLNRSNHVISLEDLLLTLKRCLPSFKFASGAELDDESHVIHVENSTSNEIKRFKIFKGVSSLPEVLEGQKLVVVDDIAPLEEKSRIAPILIPREHIELQLANTMEVPDNNHNALEEGKKPVVVDGIAPLEVKNKTAPIPLSRVQIELQFGKTMKEAAHDLEVSLSTLKRKCKVLGIYEWQGPNPVKRKVNYSRNHRDTNEEDSGAILVPSALERNGSTLTIKADFSDDMIKFDLLMLEATFFSVEKEIVKRFKLTPGTYKLKYSDEDGDWISLTSEQDMSYCIRSSNKLDRTVVRLRVLPSA